MARQGKVGSRPFQFRIRRPHLPGSETEYNGIAASVMKAHGIPINDMHTKVSNIFGKKPDRSEPYGFGKKVVILPSLVEAIKKNL